MIEKIISALDLAAHIEGGFFRETYRSGEIIPGKILPDRYGGDRCYGTAIYYMITRDTFSAMHRIKSDEIFHFYYGDPVEMLQLYPDGTGRIIILGSEIPKGMRPQVLVPGSAWQGIRMMDRGDFALMGTTVSPGFDYPDFELGNRKLLVRQYPEFKDIIVSLTREM